VAIVLCWFAAAVYNLPRFFERSTTIAQSSTTANSSSSTSSSSSVAAALVNRTALRENTVYIIVYKTALFFVARFLLPFCALAYFNTRLLQHSPTSTLAYFNTRLILVETDPLRPCARHETGRFAAETFFLQPVSRRCTDLGREGRADVPC